MLNRILGKLGLRIVSKSVWEFSQKTIDQQAERIAELESELNDIRCNFDVPPCEEVGYKIPWDMAEFIRRRDAARKKQLADISTPILPEDNLGRRVDISQFIVFRPAQPESVESDYVLNESPKKPDTVKV